ncbi:hypothetical protein DAPPUDRAFT_312298 [Daphnia pulex]|uniref:Uncharacterized protein n=1 Tax=Daphnia pulex TaxID=6669 RepID=E9G0D9_DAPPU|nr:hypothetical protein DAPPUDRAFT_312303 [Daphnia pulex]EFX87417.1 hypothetical protein DAPPUDRAFT_312298 [Daphnia pulex]|eukprot:EFX86888.1 hypothetical protein DAPPUDRAFT_312303 [Daphnia pulex]
MVKYEKDVEALYTHPEDRRRLCLLPEAPPPSSLEHGTTVKLGLPDWSSGRKNLLLSGKEGEQDLK